MQPIKRLVILTAAAIALVLIASACQPEPEVIEKEVTREVIVEVTKEVVQEVTVEVPTEVTVVVEKEVTVEVEVEVPAEPVAAIPFADLWVGSGHADAEAEAFRHWDEDDPAVVPASCAKCHSTYGYHDFLGIDGTEAGVVDNDAAIDSVIECVACHNEATEAMTSVVFPSGIEITGLGPEARCMQCHQGRASKASVDNRIEEAGLTDEDAVSEDLGFTNIHYFAAAATQAGGTAEGGYQYDGKPYDSKFVHVAGYDACVGCHDPHTLEVKVEECATCHTGVGSVEDLRDVRMEGSLVDFDGDGDLEEGIYYEIEGLRDMLYEAMQAYADEVSGTPIIYDSHTYPYFFIDTNGNGEVDEGEAAYANAYNAWTPRLAKAAYNYQTSLKDPGAYAHGGKYIIQLLYDSIENLNEALSTPVDLSTAHRIDDGHFAGSEEAFRHWDEDEPPVVSASCSKCHSAEGLPLFINEGVTISQPTANGFLCSTCHDSLTELTRYPVGEVEFPSGASLDSGNPDSNLCMNCHQGRQSAGDVDRAIAGLDPDTPSEDLGFRNVHYLPAAATLFGTEAQGVYEYPDKTYLGRNEHVDAFKNCTDCHTAHGLDVKVEACSACHAGVEDEEDLRSIRMDDVDYDGDGDTDEGVAGEIDTLHEALYAAMQDYAANVVGTPLVYESHSYPYFFIDTNGNGVADPDEAQRANAYNAWTPRLLQAAYNYQYAAKDPGTYAHNPKYIIQALYDGLESLGAQAAVDMTGMVRPESK
jgi:hypothetical protein